MEHVFVQTGPTGRSFGLRSEPRLILDDLDEGTELGEVRGDLDIFIVTIDDEPHLLLAGPAERAEHASTVVDGNPCPVKNGVWLSLPVPFTPGMQVNAIWQDPNGRELFRRLSPPLRRFEPMFGPSWTRWGPGE